MALSTAVASLAAAVGCGAPRETAPCPASQARCGAECVDEGTDPQNCGGCGLVCDQCTNGHCVLVLATAQANPGPIAVTSTEIVWANQGVGPEETLEGASIAKLPIGGGKLETLALCERTPTSLAIDSGYAYWTIASSFSFTNVPPGDVADGSVVKMPLQGGPLTVVAAGQLLPWRVAVNAGTVYWSAGGGVMSVSTTGGSPIVVAPGNIAALILSAGTAFWAEYKSINTMSVVSFKMRDLAGAAEITLNEGPMLGAVLNLAASSTDLYWTLDFPRGYVQKVALGGGGPTTVYTADDDVLDLAIATDGENLYWANQQSFFDGRPRVGRILKAPLAGGDPVTLSPTALETRFMVVDATSLYFTDVDRGAVIKVTPK